MLFRSILRQAYLAGKRLEWAPKECFRGAVVIAIFDEFSDRARVKAAKKMMKKLSAIDVSTSVDYFSIVHN